MDKLHLENQSLTPPKTNMSPKKGGEFQKEVNHLDQPWIFRGYLFVFGDILVSYSFEIWPSKALLEKPADHCGVGISRSEGRDGNRNGFAGVSRSLCVLSI